MKIQMTDNGPNGLFSVCGNEAEVAAIEEVAPRFGYLTKVAGASAIGAAVGSLILKGGGMALNHFTREEEMPEVAKAA